METAEKCAAEILHGLSFNKQMQAKKTRDLSGGWEMRIALARALFVKSFVIYINKFVMMLCKKLCNLQHQIFNDALL